MDYDTFMTQLMAFHEEKGTVLAPQKLLGYHINLFEMFLGSMRQGGFPRVNKNSKWGHIAKAIKIVPQDAPVSAADQEQIKKFYVKWIRGFEGDCISPALKKMLIPEGMELPPRKKRMDAVNSGSPSQDASHSRPPSSPPTRGGSGKVGLEGAALQESERRSAVNLNATGVCDEAPKKRKCRKTSDSVEQLQPCTDVWRLSLGLHNRRNSPEEFIYCLNCLYYLSQSKQGIYIKEFPSVLDITSELICESLEVLDRPFKVRSLSAMDESPSLVNELLCRIVGCGGGYVGFDGWMKELRGGTPPVNTEDTSTPFGNRMALHIINLCCAILSNIMQRSENQYYMAGFTKEEEGRVEEGALHRTSVHQKKKVSSTVMERHEEEVVDASNKCKDGSRGVDDNNQRYGRDVSLISQLKDGGETQIKSTVTSLLGAVACCIEYAQLAEEISYKQLCCSKEHINNIFNEKCKDRISGVNGYKRVGVQQNEEVEESKEMENEETTEEGLMNTPIETTLPVRFIHPAFTSTTSTGDLLFGTTIEDKMKFVDTSKIVNKTNEYPLRLNGFELDGDTRAFDTSEKKGTPSLPVSSLIVSTTKGYKRKKLIASLDIRKKNFVMKKVEYNYISSDLHASSSIFASAQNCEVNEYDDKSATHFCISNNKEEMYEECDVQRGLWFDKQMDAELEDTKYAVCCQSNLLMEWMQEFVDAAIASITALNSLIYLLPNFSWVSDESTKMMCKLMSFATPISGRSIPRVFHNTSGFQLLQAVLELSTQLLLFKHHASAESVSILSSVAASVLDLHVDCPEAKVPLQLTKASLSYLRLCCEFALLDILKDEKSGDITPPTTGVPPQDILSSSTSFVSALIRYIQHKMELSVKAQHHSSLYRAHDVLIEKKLELNDNNLRSGCAATGNACVAVLPHNKRRKVGGVWKFAKQMEWVDCKESMNMLGSEEDEFRELLNAKAAMRGEGSVTGVTSVAPQSAIGKDRQEDGIQLRGVPPPLKLSSSTSTGLKTLSRSEGGIQDPLSLIGSSASLQDFSPYPKLQPVDVRDIPPCPTPQSVDPLLNQLDTMEYGIGVMSVFTRIILNGSQEVSDRVLMDRPAGTGGMNGSHSQMMEAMNGVSHRSREYAVSASNGGVKRSMMRRNEYGMPPRSGMDAQMECTAYQQNGSSVVPFIHMGDVEDSHSMSHMNKQIRPTYQHGSSPPIDSSDKEEGDGRNDSIQITEEMSDVLSVDDPLIGGRNEEAPSQMVADVNEEEEVDIRLEDGGNMNEDVQPLMETDGDTLSDASPNTSTAAKPIEHLNSIWFHPLKPLLNAVDTKHNTIGKHKSTGGRDTPTEYTAKGRQPDVDVEDVKEGTPQVADVSGACKVALHCILYLVSNRQTIGLVEPFLPTLIELAWLETTLSSSLWSIVNELLSCGMTGHLNNNYVGVDGTMEGRILTSGIDKCSREFVFISKQNGGMKSST